MTPSRINRISFKIPMLGISLLCLSLTCVSWILYSYKKSDLEKSISRELIGIAITSTLMIDAEDHEDIFVDILGEIEGQESFESIKTILKNIQKKNNLERSIYTLRKTPDFELSSLMEFVAMSQPDSTGNYYVGNIIPTTKYIDEVYQIRTPVATPLYTDSEGVWISAIAPIFDNQENIIGVLHVDRDVEFVETALAKLRLLVFGVSGITLVLGGLLLVIFTFPITQRIKKLTQGIQKISSGALDYRIDLKGKDELSVLAYAFDHMTNRLSSTLVSKDYVENIIHSLGEMLFVTNTDGNVISINPAVHQFLGYTEQDLLNRPIGALLEDTSNTFCLRKSSSDVPNFQNIEKTFKHKNGDILPVLFTYSPMYRSDNTIIGFVGVAQSIRALKEADLALRSSRDELANANQELKQKQVQLVQSEKMAGLGQMAAGVAHEINNPIGFISSNLGTMKDYLSNLLAFFDAYKAEAHKNELENSFKENDLEFVLQDAQDLIDESLEGVERVQEIVLGLKNFARLDEAERKEADINEGIESTLKLVWNELKYRCTINKEFEKLPPILCYPGQLNQVFMNLLVNAAQAIQEQGEITIKTWSDENNINITISDTGTGIEPENLNKLFDPFFTTKSPGHGTGLGLSISHGIIKKHNGTIDVDSVLGKGTTFTICLPLAPL